MMLRVNIDVVSTNIDAAMQTAKENDDVCAYSLRLDVGLRVSNDHKSISFWLAKVSSPDLMIDFARTV